MPVKGDASSRTTSAIAEGTIDIRENPTQDISALSRNTENALNELGRIFDKKKIEEQQELAAVFGEEAFRLAHNMKDDGSGRKIAVHAIIGGIMSQITGAGFASGAVGAGLNEALINAVKGKDPGTAQIVSAIIGAAAAKVAGGSAAAGASAAATGTKWNYFLMSRPKEFGINELAKNILRKKDGRELSEEEVDAFLRESNNILSDMEPDLGLDKENPFAEDINNYQNVIRYLEYHGVATDSAKRFFTAYNETVRNRDWTGVYNKPDSIAVVWDLKESKLVDLRPPIPVYNPFDTRTYQEGQIIGGGYSSKSQKMEDDNNPLGEGTHPGGQAIGGGASSGTQKAEDDEDFDVLKSTVTNTLSDTANRLPEGIKMAGYFVRPLTVYVKISGVGAIGLTVMDIQKDWGTYSGTNLTQAILADLLPITLSFGLGSLTASAGGPAAILTGSAGAITGSVIGDRLKYEWKKGLPKDTHDK